MPMMLCTTQFSAISTRTQHRYEEESGQQPTMSIGVASQRLSQVLDHSLAIGAKRLGNG